MRAVWGAVAAIAAAAGLAPAARAAAPPGPAPWLGPVAVQPERSAQFSSSGAALAADGRGIVVWASRAPRFEITTVDVGADGVLGAPVVVSAPGDHASAPLVGMALDGEAIVAWRTGPGARGVSLCIRPAFGGSCAAQRISVPGRRAVLQSLAVDVDGSAIVAWLQQTAAGWRAAIAERAAGAPSFGRMRLVGPPGASAADVALGPASATLVFSRATVLGARGGSRAARHGSQVRLASWLRGEAPARTTVVSPRTHVAVTPRVAVDDHDDAVIAWEWMHGANRFAIAYARIRDCARAGCSNGPGALAALGQVRRLGPRVVRRGVQASTADLTVSATGRRLLVGWIHLPGDERSPSQIRLSQWADGALAAPVRISDARYSGFDPQVLARGERTLVVYREYGRPGVRDGLVVARVADGATLGFGPLSGLSSPALVQQSAARPRLALGPSGAALGVFTEYGADASGAGRLSLARLPAAAE